MREIEFRGKLTNNRGWAYGNLSIKPHNECAIITPDNTPLGRYGKVEIETVGQYTGLKDQNGTKVFEGDILEFEFESIGKQKAIVYYSDRYASFCLNPVDNFQYALIRDGRVIGNIYDNPELLIYRRNNKGV